MTYITIKELAVASRLAFGTPETRPGLGCHVCVCPCRCDVARILPDCDFHGGFSKVFLSSSSPAALFSPFETGLQRKRIRG